MITTLHKLIGEARRSNRAAARDLRTTFDFLGIDVGCVNTQEIFKRRRGGIDEDKVAHLVQARNIARRAKNFQEADRIRDELETMGIELEDKDGTTTWKVVR